MKRHNSSYEKKTQTGDTIPRRTISLAGSTYGLIKAVALLDVNCFQVSFSTS